ncbi:hypothetical protein RRG08_024355 [Elysia crispata]|uniref:Uncharacterized protein n=1 Tax=Elysia crispata TaxID=231223 RepID=A0AAE0ZLU4_9GAST|nr:hypothetical protein RRG08_024355 [Elysia crispata]
MFQTQPLLLCLCSRLSPYSSVYVPDSAPTPLFMFQTQPLTSPYSSVYVPDSAPTPLFMFQTQPLLLCLCSRLSPYSSVYVPDSAPTPLSSPQRLIPLLSTAVCVRPPLVGVYAEQGGQLQVKFHKLQVPLILNIRSHPKSAGKEKDGHQQHDRNREADGNWGPRDRLGFSY